VIETLYVVLGVDPKARPAQTDPQVQQQQLQMMQQLQQQGGKNMAKMLQPEGPKVFLAYNRQMNSVMANAPPREMKIIEQTIELMDVPFGGDTLGEGSLADSSDGNGSGRTMEKYPLTTLDPENFVTTLEQIGGLSPFAEFKVDKKSKTLFALATEADHGKIKDLIEDFDGSGRRFRVIQLRRRPALAVAETIYKLMAGQEDEQQDDNRRRYYWDWWDRGRDDDEEKPVKGFGVDADVENNQLLLWATDAEAQRVNDLLLELGEYPSGHSDQRPVRFIQPSGEKPTADLLEQLREAWSASGGNELIIKQSPPTKPDAPPEKKKNAETKAESSPATDRSTKSDSPHSIAARFAQLAAATGETDSPSPTNKKNNVPDSAGANAGAQDAESQQPAAAPPVTITVTEDGRLMLSSPDVAALDQLELLIESFRLPKSGSGSSRCPIYRPGTCGTT
jgi:hypothetical protein